MSILEISQRRMRDIAKSKLKNLYGKYLLRVIVEFKKKVNSDTSKK